MVELLHTFDLHFSLTTTPVLRELYKYTKENRILCFVCFLEMIVSTDKDINEYEKNTGIDTKEFICPSLVFNAMWL
jgi:hypothetical protein